jgi:hypothetical protein
LKEREAPIAGTVVTTGSAVPILHRTVAVVIEERGGFVALLDRMEAWKPCGPGNGGGIEMFCAALVLTCCRPEYRLLTGLKDSRGIWALAEMTAARIQFPVLVRFFKEIGANCICANSL